MVTLKITMFQWLHLLSVCFKDNFRVTDEVFILGYKLIVLLRITSKDDFLVTRLIIGG
ncbi:MAG TPA: hypothetical protein P5123_03835 [Spirochaetota bacterium]|nr:hypothetical protein [Spirochaetota bacterium]